jgi:putative ABC transport system substrate-binding protein
VYGVLVNPSRQQNREQFKKLKDVAKPRGLKLIRRRASKPGAIKKAYDFFRKKNAVGVVVMADGFFNNNRTKIIEEAAAPDPANNRIGVPTIYQWKEFTDNFTDGTGVEQNGGLMSFGPSMTEAYKKAGEYIGQVANGVSPSDIKCSKPEENLIEVWVNDRTARHHGFDLTKIPPQLGNKPVNRRP